MLLQLPDVLSPQQVSHCRSLLNDAQWVDGKVTAGYQSAKAKNNTQLLESDPVAQEVCSVILSALDKDPLFISAALPLKIFPPLFNRYEGGQAFGTHIDNAIRQIKGTQHRIRTDLSATLFFSEPDEYEGGELVIEDTYGVQKIKLPAGHMILYPASSLHHVTPVTKGARVCSFFWMQSMVRDDSKRALLFDMDVAIQKLNINLPDNPSAIQLTGIYHNLLRMWADI